MNAPVTPQYDSPTTLRHAVGAAALCVLAVSSLIHAQAPPSTFAERVVALRTSSNLPAVGGVTFTSSSIGAVAVSGVRKLGDPAAVTPDDLWHIGSVTKSVTSALIAKRVERGELKLDATLGELLGHRGQVNSLFPIEPGPFAVRAAP